MFLNDGLQAAAGNVFLFILGSFISGDNEETIAAYKDIQENTIGNVHGGAYLYGASPVCF